MKSSSLSMAIALLAMPLAASAQFAKPEDAQRYRKAVFTVMAAHFSQLAAMANGRAPFDAKLAATHADLLGRISHLPYPAFVEGSDQGATQAKPDIWLQPALFKAAARRSQDDIAKLGPAAQSADLARLKSAVSAVGQSCKSCHDEFRRRSLSD